MFARVLLALRIDCLVGCEGRSKVAPEMGGGAGLGWCPRPAGLLSSRPLADCARS